MSTLAAGAAGNGIDASRADHRHRALPARLGGGLRGDPLAAYPRNVQPRRVGAGRAGLRHVRDLVPARRRPLHRLHLRGGAGGALRQRRGQRLLRRALHDHRLSAHLHLHAEAVVGRTPARLRHPGRLHPRALRLALFVTGDRPHRDPGDDALHRPAAGGNPGGARGDRHRWRRKHLRQGPAAVHRLRHPRRIHLLQRASRARADRLREGLPDLPRRHRGDHLHPLQTRRIRQDLRRRAGEDEFTVGACRAVR